MSKVTVVQTGSAQEVDITATTTAAQALDSANIETGEGVEIRLNGAVCKDLDTVLRPGDLLMAVGEIAGG